MKSAAAIDTPRDNRLIIMVGTSTDARGGIATAVSVLRQGGLFERCGAVYIPSHRDGNAVAKLSQAFRSWARFVGYLLRGKAALLHAHMAARTSCWRKLLFILTARAFNIPYLIHLHSGAFQAFYENETSIFLRWLLKNTFENARVVVVVSRSWETWITTQFPRARARTIFNPIVLPAAVPRHAASQDLLFLGRIEAQKGVFDLIRAFARISPAFDQSRLAMAGTGSIAEAKALAVELGVEDRVDLLGWVDGPRKADLLSHVAAYVLPSYYEGLPMSILEAMAVGLPIVATSVGGIPEVITDGTEGFLVEPGDVDALADRLLTLLAEPALRQRMGKAARQKVETAIAVERIIAEWDQLYTEIREQR